MYLPIKTIIYGLWDPRDGLVYYVGQSKRGLKRAYMHLSLNTRLRDKSSLKNVWIESVLAAGLEPLPCVLEVVLDASLLAEREEIWINHLRTSYNPNLTNCSKERWRQKKGPISEATRNKQSRRAKQLWADPVYRQMMSDRQKGRVFTAEHRANVSKGQRRRFENQVERRKYAEMHKGRSFCISTPESRLKLAKAKGARLFVDQFGNRYESVREAGRLLNLDSSSISKVLKGKIFQAKGYRFSYVES